MSVRATVRNAAHRGGGGQAVAGDVTDDQRRASAGQRHHVVPVPADPVRVDGGGVVGVHPEAGRVGRGAREQGALERHDVLAFTPVEPGVVHEHGCHGGELSGQVQVGAVEGRAVTGAHEVRGAQQDTAGDQRHRHVAVHALAAHRRLRAVRRRDARVVTRGHPSDQYGLTVAQALGGQQRLTALQPVHHLAHRGGFELRERVDGADRHGAGDGHRGAGDALALLAVEHGLQQVDGGGVGQPGDAERGQLLGRALQVQRRADPGARLVEPAHPGGGGEAVTPGPGGFRTAGVQQAGTAALRGQPTGQASRSASAAVHRADLHSRPGDASLVTSVAAGQHRQGCHVSEIAAKTPLPDDRYGIRTRRRARRGDTRRARTGTGRQRSSTPPPSPVDAFGTATRPSSAPEASRGWAGRTRTV